MRTSKRARRRAKLQRRYRAHWRHMLAIQTAAYLIVLLLWALPIPNPVKLLAVTFHEFSHALAALVTGGRVFGFAIDPGGAGVTIGVGGVLPVILVAGYAGSALCGVLLYFVSVQWRANTALFTLVLLVLGSMLFGWLSSYTALFGFGALIVMLFLFPLRDAVKTFFIRMVGSACCLYAPLDIIGDVLGAGGAPKVRGAETASDLAQLAEITGIHPVPIAAVILALQVGLLVWVIRWTCSRGAREALREESHEARTRRRYLDDVSQNRKVYVVRKRH